MVARHTIRCDPRSVYLIERHVDSQAELQGVVAAYAQPSEAAGVPAILANLRTAGELADAFA